MITENGIKEQAVLLKDGLIKERDRISALISEIDSFVDEPVGESLPMELPSASQNEEPISIIGAAIAIISKHGPIKTPTLLDLLNQNGLSSGEVLQPGMTLSIPSTGSFPGTRALQPHPTQYTVAVNDTFYSIACAFGDVDPNSIAAANGLAITAPLTTGRILNIP